VCVIVVQAINGNVTDVIGAVARYPTHDERELDQLIVPDQRKLYECPDYAHTLNGALRG
jgi:hypothetical protein